MISATNFNWSLTPNKSRQMINVKKRCCNERPDPKFGNLSLINAINLCVLLRLKKWGSGSWVISILFVSSAQTFAACEPEMNDWIQMHGRAHAEMCKSYSCTGDGPGDFRRQVEKSHETTMKSNFGQFYRPGEAEKYIDGMEQNILKGMNSYRNTRSEYLRDRFHILAGVNESKYRICLAKWEISRQAAIKNKAPSVANGTSAVDEQKDQKASDSNTPIGPKENCEALFTAERLQRLPGPQYVQEFSDCLKRNVARGKAQTAVQVEAPPLQAAQQQAQQSRAAQQQSQQAVFNSAQNQTAADQTRKSERRRHEPENEAHDCLSLDKSGLFGGIVNKCDFKVAYQFCNFNPKKDSWAESHTCGKSGGADFVGAGRTSAAHVKNTETVYWFACKDPAWPVDVEYVAGKGIQARCYTIGGK